MFWDPKHVIKEVTEIPKKKNIENECKITQLVYRQSRRNVKNNKKKKRATAKLCLPLQKAS